MCLHGNDWARKLFERWQLRERLLLSSCLNLTQLLLSCQRKPDWKQDEMSSNDLGAVSQATGLVSVSCRRFTSHPRGPFSCFQGESALIYVLFCLLFFSASNSHVKNVKTQRGLWFYSARVHSIWLPVTSIYPACPLSQIKHQRGRREVGGRDST